jgi:hypothetical protein
LNISFQIPPTLTGAIISGKMSTFSKPRPIGEERFNNSGPAGSQRIPGS